jgi:Domain of unknown function (DUF5666)
MRIPTDRREFLKLGGSAAISAMGFLYPGISRFLPSQPGASAQAAPNIVSVDGLDPTYAGGRLVARTDDGFVLAADRQFRAVRLPDAAMAWKEFDVPAQEIEVGDWVDVKGIPLADGSLLARDGWIFANIGRRDGILENASARAFTLRTRHGSRTFELSPILEVIHAESGLPVRGGVEGLEPGATLGAVGLVLSDGGFRATRIWRH